MATLDVEATLPEKKKPGPHAVTFEELLTKDFVTPCYPDDPNSLQNIVGVKCAICPNTTVWFVNKDSATNQLQRVQQALRKHKGTVMHLGNLKRHESITPPPATVSSFQESVVISILKDVMLSFSLIFTNFRCRVHHFVT
jgi:hypothetical protein